MSVTDYWVQVSELSKKNGDAHKALLAFLEKNPRPNGLDLIEYDKLSLAYVVAFNAWFGFCGANVNNR